jgi:hypothetical protein
MRYKISIVAVSLLAMGAAVLMAQTQSSPEVTSYKARPAKASTGVVISVESIKAFTHYTFISADADLKSIRFQGVKKIRLATKVRSTLDPAYCENESADAGAGGSLLCPRIEAMDYEPSYQVTYSYQGPPLSSDEYGDKRFSFSVFFRPEELDGSIPGSFLRNKRAAAESLRVITSSEMAERLVIDEKASTLCPGHYADAEWVPDDANCQDKVLLRVLTTPSDYVRVSVEAPARRADGELLR